MPQNPNNKLDWSQATDISGLNDYVKCVECGDLFPPDYMEGDLCILCNHKKNSKFH